MKYSIFSSVKAQQGELCTYEKFMETVKSEKVAEICAAVAKEADHENQQLLKKGLPVVTWQAYFESQRKNELAEPSGLCMVDIDHVDDPKELWLTIVGRREELGILLAHMTPSRHGLRLIFRCRKGFSTLDECQRWMSHEIGVTHDPACKDWARASYVVPQNYIYFLDAKGLFSEEPQVVYEVKSEGEMIKWESSTTNVPSSVPAPLQTTYRGLELKEIAKQWLLMNGGEPVEGQRNDCLHRLAYVMRSITDYNEEVLMAALPRYGLGDEEVRRFIHSACIATPTNGIPPSLQKVIEQMLAGKRQNEDSAEDLDVPLASCNTQLPPLPPLIKELAKTAPTDFKKAVVLCQLPLLGTLGSKLRAQYLDGKSHSPSFQVSLEAPQGSGKSFMTDIANLLLAPIEARDAVERQLEQAYAERVAEAKNTNAKTSIGPRPKGIVRSITATTSNTQLMARMSNSQGLHLIIVSPEIDSVAKALKRDFANYSDVLRKAFDNDNHGQDYYSSDTISVVTKVYFNTLFSGTPNAMRRFYPDVEDGLVSRVLFVTLPDQFGKRMPKWCKLRGKDLAEVERQIERLDKISIVEGVVQKDHVMELGFLNKAMENWLEENRLEAIRTKDYTRDTFYRRSAVVGFRAGMLAWYLYGEKNTPTIRKNTIAFSKWVADQMLTQHILRFDLNEKHSNTNKWFKEYDALGEEFTLEEMQRVFASSKSNTPIKNVLYKWHLAECIEDIENAIGANGKPHPVRFRKR